MNTQELLAAIRSDIKAGKSIEVADFGESVLNPTQFNRFLRVLEEQSIALGESRQVTMTSDKYNIDLTEWSGWVLHAGDDAAGAHRDVDQTDHTEPAFRTNKLIAEELVAYTSLRDRAARRNIERARFEQTLLDMFGERVGNNFGAYAFLADSGLAYGVTKKQDALAQTDGWIKLSPNHLFGADQGTGDGSANNAAKDFDASAIGTTDYATAGTQARTILQLMLETMDKKYMGADASGFRYYATWDFFDAYREEWIKRTGGRADDALARGFLPDYKGIPVVYAPELNEDLGGNRHVVLSHPDNQVYGIFHQVTVEPERLPKQRKTDFVLTLEGDVGYEDENASVCAHLDQDAGAYA